MVQQQKKHGSSCAEELTNYQQGMYLRENSERRLDDQGHSAINTEMEKAMEEGETWTNHVGIRGG
jgi:hypothetical protein